LIYQTSNQFISSLSLEIVISHKKIDGDNMGSNWGCYPPSEVAKNDKLSAYPLGFVLILQMNLSTSYSQNSNHTQHKLGPLLQASIYVDLIPTASTKKQKWLYTMNGKGDRSFKRYIVWETYHS
jgi:hypothetical protein